MTIPRLAILTALVALALAAAGPATAAKPCWTQLLNDWWDGRIDKAYPVSCYRAAIDNLPEDVSAYSNAREEINRALLAALREGEGPGDPLEGSDPVPPQPRTGTDEVSTVGEDDDDFGEAVGPGDDEGGLGDVLRPSNADSIPIPLLVLAGLALVLLAAAAAGFVARRIQARRVRVGPPPPSA